MHMIPVVSSAISAIGYALASRQMKIKFVQGHTYDFCGVPQAVFNGFFLSYSKGAYYNNFIRDRYQCY